MEPKHDLVHLEFEIPARGLIGFRTQVMNITAGEAIIASRFKDYEPVKGDFKERINGTIVALETGSAIAYAINKLQDRGEFLSHREIISIWVRL